MKLKTNYLKNLRSTHILRNKKYVAIALVFIILLAALALALVDRHSRQKNQQIPIDTGKISELADQGNCKKSIQELADVRSDEKNQEATISLLSYRASCYYSLDKYPEALKDYEELRDIYQKTNDEDLNSVASIIREIKDYINNPKSIPKNNPDTELKQMTPEFRKQIEAENEGQQ